ncbi:BN159_2729 family protein [Streptomyces sp. NPDC013313]|uniref:BN159_2729 family protein n=1 Tax=Streptomyces sp. NPDC013313 TaxID=3155603 RepID=UPI0033C6AB0B
MTDAYGKDSDVERELTARLRELAHAFIADLNAQGRLVETGGADTLRRLRQHNLPPHPLPHAEPGDPHATGAETTQADAHPAPNTPPRWERVIAPRAGKDTPALPPTPRPLRILDEPEPYPPSAHTPDPRDAPAAAPQAVALEPSPAHQITALQPVPAEQAAVPTPAPAGQATVLQPVPAGQAVRTGTPTPAPAPEAAGLEPVRAGQAAGVGAPAPAPAPEAAVLQPVPTGTGAPAPAPAPEAAGLEPVHAGQAAGVGAPVPAPAPEAAVLEPVPAGQAAGHGPVPGQGPGARESRAADGGQVQSSAAVTAARLRAENAARLEVTQITADHEGVSVHIHAVSLGDWEYWLSAIGAPLNAPTHRSGWVQTATGRLDGVEVRLTAEAVPRLLQEAAQQATDPFLLGGRVYDLALGHTDRHGQTWHYQGRRQEDDIPLVTLGGTGGPSYPLTSIVVANGPLTPAAANPDPHERR